MHVHPLERWQHDHHYLGQHHRANERRTWLVVALTGATMVAEIAGGTIYGSMALVADGWHMATHAGALAIAALAYRFAWRHARDPRLSFGTGKLGELAGFASAVILGIVALLIGYESVVRLVHPAAIDFQLAAMIGVIGLAVNLVSAWLLHDSGQHTHHGARDHAADHDHAHTEDHNIQSAYFHVLADALTSVLAIVALLAGWFYGLAWLDPAVGVVGAVIIAWWAVGLIRSAGAVLLDAAPDPRLTRAIRERLEVDGDRVSDLHLWRLGPGHSAVIVAIVSDQPRSPSFYKTRLAGIAGLSHVTVEVNRCPDHGPVVAA
jgi:cation diffusion facilitator family transporter